MTDFFGEKLLEHGGSIIVSTARIALVPERRIGVVMMGNSGGMPYHEIADAVLAILLGEDADTEVPSIAIRKRMDALDRDSCRY